jgi:hypothetical protein
MTKAIDYVIGDHSLRLSYPSGSHPSTIVMSRTTGAFTWASISLSLKEGFGRDGDHGPRNQMEPMEPVRASTSHRKNSSAP